MLAETGVHGGRTGGMDLESQLPFFSLRAGFPQARGRPSTVPSLPAPR